MDERCLFVLSNFRVCVPDGDSSLDELHTGSNKKLK